MTLVGKAAPEFSLDGYYKGKFEKFSRQNFEGKWLTVQMRDQFTRVLASSNDFAVLFRFLKTGPR